MKVLHIVSAYPRFEGDVITPWLVETVKRLKEQGVEITIFAPSYKGLSNQMIFGIPVVRFRYFFKRWENLTHEETAPDRVSRSFFYKLLVPFYVISGTLKIVFLCRRERFDVIQVHWPVPHTIFGYTGKIVSKARLILSFYGVELRWVKKKMPILRSFLKWSLNRADLVTCISTHTKDEILELTSKPACIIPFGAGLEITAKEASPASPPEILFVGRLVERKGVKYLIDAFRLLAQDIDCCLYIVGDGPEKPNLETQVQKMGLQNKVVLTGQIPEKDLQKRYQSCSVFVLPAITDSKGDTEGLGVVLIEALTYKRPVVASRVGGIVDIVEDGRTGLLVPEKDSQALGHALRKLLSDQKLAQRLAEQGYKYVKEKFAWDKIIGQVLEAYRSCQD
jgi:glycosyltransferase involved in cell wall biosynthesis